MRSGILLLACKAPAAADHLAAPANVSCSGDGTNLDVEWDDVTGATKYSVVVIAGYDTDGDTVVDTSVEFDFGTSDRTDGNPISDSDLTIPLSGLVVDAEGQGTALRGWDAAEQPVLVSGELHRRGDPLREALSSGRDAAGHRRASGSPRPGPAPETA